MRIAVAQLRAELKVFLREPSDLFFSVALPLLFLVLFTSIFGNQSLGEGTGLRVAQVMVPGFICFALIGSGFVALTINLVGKRERGMLKRARATPAPLWALFAALAGKALVVGGAVTVVLMVVGRIGYQVAVPWSHLPAVVVTVVVGAVAMSCLGVAVTGLVPTEDASSAITNAVTLPLFFISGVFVPAEQLPDTLLTIAGLFPVRPLYQALVAAFDPRSGGAGFSPGALALLVAWGALGFVVARTTFRPFPRRDRE